MIVGCFKFVCPVEVQLESMCTAKKLPLQGSLVKSLCSVGTCPGGNTTLGWMCVAWVGTKLEIVRLLVFVCSYARDGFHRFRSCLHR